MSTMHEPSMSTRDRSTARSGHRTLAQTFATVVGATFLIVGIAGFVPGITSNVDDMEFAGHESGSELLGIFQVSILHNIVHLLFGIAGLVAARKGFSAARNYLIGGGVIYLVLWLYGLITDNNEDANFVPVNTADDWLHFGLGVGMIALGVIADRAFKRDRDPVARRSMA
jgi:hypothetical protein